jgi:flagellar hook protein FlgE
MMRSLFSGVSGLKTHQTRMDVIGNNIANVNTTAYKSKSINFSDLIYQTTQSATGPNTENGTAGTNPRQIGLGVKTGAINTSITTEGSSQSTGNPFDLKITGEAFFVVSDGTNQYFTRDGSFNVDSAGYLCMSNTGYIVQGWTNTDATTGAIIQDTVKPIRVLSDANSTYAAEYTTKATISGIIDKYDDQLDTDYGKIVNIQVLDDMGYEYNLKFGITPTQTVENSTRDIVNTENEYKPATTLYKVDTSSLVYTYSVGSETRTLSSSDSPELMSKLEDAIWNAVNTGTASNGVNPANYATNGTVSVDLQAFIAADNDLKNATLTNSELRSITDLTVTFSGDTGYVVATTKPTYPLSSSLTPISISDEAVAALYTAGNTANGVTEYTLNTDYASVTSLKQVYTDDDGNSVTEYTFKDKDGKEIADITSDMNDDILKVLGLGTKSDTQNVYTTQEAKQTTKDDPGKYTLKLLDVTDSDGIEPSNLSSLMNNATTSWQLSYSTDDGTFQYVGSAGNTSFTLSLTSLGTNFSNVTFDMTNTSNVNNGGKSTVAGTKDDGRKVGNLTGVSIGTDGVITASYDNGMQKDIAQIAVATFANAMGLENAGDNLYTTTANSGDFDGVGVDIKGSGTGYMTTGVLEMSNVDLATEFTNMITTQRGFQANSRIITTSDSLLEELVNLKR